MKPSSASTSRLRRGVILAASIVGLWFILALAGWRLNPIIRKGLPSDVSDQRDYVLVPRSGLYQISAQRIGYGVRSRWLPLGPVKPQRGVIKLMPRSGRWPAELNLDLVRGTAYGLPGTNGPMDSETIVLYMEVYNFNEQDLEKCEPQLRAELAEVVALVKTPDFDPAHQPPLSNFNVTMTSTRTYYPSDQEATLVNGVWVVLGLIGTSLLVRRWRRKAIVAGFEIQPTVVGAANLPPNLPQVHV